MADPEPEPEPTVLIIGAGAFGVSTAYHLAQTYRDPSRVTILDREPPSSLPPSPASSPSHRVAAAASVDISRIVRADHPSALYRNLASEALHRWFWSPELGPTFHRAGGLVLLPDDEADDDDEASRGGGGGGGGGGDDVVALADVAAGRGRSHMPWWGPLLAGTDTRGFGRAYLNRDAGWADAAAATARFLEAAARRGVRREVGEVAELLLLADEGGGGGGEEAGMSGPGRRKEKERRVGGARTADGRRFAADRIVVAAGAWTSWLLSPAEEALGVPEADGVERQAQAAAVATAYYRVAEGDVARMAERGGMPCVVYGGVGEVVPAWPDNGLLRYSNLGTKVVNTVTVTGTRGSSRSGGRKMSVPPPSPPAPADGEEEEEHLMEKKNVVPDALRRETEAVLTSRLMPAFTRGRRPERWRLCWDSLTPTGDLLLCRHPSIEGLYIMAGGSFCGYKFMPNIGQYMLNVLNGISNGPEKDKAWGWKSEAELRAAKVARRAELRDFEEGGNRSRL